MQQSVSSDTLAQVSIAGQSGSSSHAATVAATGPIEKSKGKNKAPKNTGGQKQAPKPNASTSAKLRGMDKDSPEVRISKTLSWLLRHGAQGEGLAMRKDGYVKVTDLLEHPKLKAQGLDLEKIKGTVKSDSKQRYDLILESSGGVKLATFGESAIISPITSASSTDARSATPPAGVEDASKPSSATETTKDGIWWIKARQGHSIKTVQLDLKPIRCVADIPTGMAIHGTNSAAWEIISNEGLSKMKRNHIHLAQNVAGKGVVSGMRTSSKILIYIDIQKALDAGIKFWFSDNGVVLTEGDERGYLSKVFFEKVVDSLRGVELKGWRTA